MFGLPLEQIIFLVLAGLAVLTSLGLILFKDPVHCALFLVLTFFNVAGVYILMGAEFMAAIQVMVYSGAILVLFLFVMMLLQIKPGPSLNPIRFLQSGLGPIIAVVFFAEVILVIFTTGFAINGGKITDANNRQAQQIQQNVQAITEGKVPLTAPGGINVPANALGGTPNTAGHTALFGKELYTTYLFPFEVASLILLIAAIGAIVIARRSLDYDPGELGERTGISLGGRAAPGSPQAEEIAKERTRERELIMRK